MVHGMMSSLVSPGDKAYDGAIIVSVSYKTGTKDVCSLIISYQLLGTV